MRNNLVLWAAESRGCATGLRQFYYVKIIIACGILALWLLLAGFYVFMVLRARAEAAELEAMSSKELEARVLSYTKHSRTEARRPDAYPHAINVPLGMAPTGEQSFFNRKLSLPQSGFAPDQELCIFMHPHAC